MTQSSFVYICSPCRGDIQGNLKKARTYCRMAVSQYEVVPLAPHLYFTQFLDDDIPAERDAGLQAGIRLLDLCSEIWVFGLDKPSEGMKYEIEYAKAHGIRIEDGFKKLSIAPEMA